MTQSKPTIFYVLNSRWPTIKAHGLQVAKTCQALVQAGTNVELIIPRRAEYDQIRGVDPFLLYGIKDQFKLTRLPSLDVTHGKWWFGLQQGLFVILAWLSLLFKKGIIYTRDPFSASFFSAVGKKVFWESHRFPGDIQGGLYRGLLKRVTGIVVITEGLRQLFLKAGVPADRLMVIPDAVDPEEFAIPQTTAEARQELLLPPGRTIIGYVGQLSTLGEDKGITDLLHAFVQVRAQIPDALLLVVGGSEPDIAHYRRMAEDLGLKATDVVFAGNHPHARVPLYLRACDVLAMPYPNTPHYALYMSPLKLFEYLAAGKPIVTTDLPSIREIVGDDDVLFARSGNADSIAQAIGSALANPHERVGREIALAQKYSWRARAEKILGFIAI